MKGCVQWNSIYGRENFVSSGDRTRSARSVSILDITAQSDTAMDLKALLGHCDQYCTVHIYCHISGSICGVLFVFRRTVYYNTTLDLIKP